MKTLVTDPFEDDARSILEWAYGSDARKMFDDNLVDGPQRAGQSFMNTLWTFDPESYLTLSGSLVDPFYQDKNIPAAIDKMTKK